MLKNHCCSGYLLITLFFLSVQALQAQTPATIKVDTVSDQVIERYYRAAQARGMSESQIEAAALANGYSREDIEKVRARLSKLTSGKTGTPNKGNVNPARKMQLEEVSRRKSLPVKQDSAKTRDPISLTQDNLFAPQKKKEIFGSSVFNNEKLDFEPNLRIATPASYIIGPDDELRIDISGYAYQHYSARVSPEGTVKIESLAPIYLNGLTVAQAKEKIGQRLKTLFGGLRNGSLTMDLTLGDVRSIKVTVVGETTYPGTYTVPSLATVFHALYLSGGPSPNGSYRNIQVIRQNRIIQHIDLYPFVVKGLSPGNISLQDQDVILIPVADRKVEFEGEISRPVFFELKPDETFKDLLTYAGGFNENAYSASVKITRKSNREKQLVTLDEKDFDNFTLKHGDVITVGTIIDRFENKAEIEGAVFRPGEYAISDQLKTVKQLISKAEGLQENAFLNRAILTRQRENLDPEYLSIDLGKLLKGEIQDIELRKEDLLIIKSISEVREFRKVSISGAVIQAGEYDYVDNMSVGDLILIAGGFTEGATNKRVEIARRVFNDESNNKTVEILNVEISKDLKLPDASTVLKPFDNVFIRELPNYQEQKIVKIHGEVNYPGAYAIENRNEKINDLIQRAGGLRPEADVEGAKFYRDYKLVAVSLKQAVSSPKSVNNLTLEDKDELFIPKEQQTIHVSGYVLNPTSVAFQPDYSFKDYIAQAGGFGDSAFVRKTYVQYANGLTDRTRSFLFFRKFPEVRKGMNIVVPPKHREKLSKAEIISISTGMVSLSAVLLTLLRVF